MEDYFGTYWKSSSYLELIKSIHPNLHSQWWSIIALQWPINLILVSATCLAWYINTFHNIWQHSEHFSAWHCSPGDWSHQTEFVSTPPQIWHWPAGQHWSETVAMTLGHCPQGWSLSWNSSRWTWWWPGGRWHHRWSAPQCFPSGSGQLRQSRRSSSNKQ